jgi:hypothetical protein
MNAADLIVHACEQVRRFTRVAAWADLSEERKIQLGFNAGIMVLGLNLNKAEGYDALTQAREGKMTMLQVHEHFKSLVIRQHCHP